MGSLRRRRERLLGAVANGRRAGHAGAGPDTKERRPQPADEVRRSRPCSGAVQAPVRAHAKNEVGVQGARATEARR
jgi:hypothetical protein